MYYHFTLKLKLIIIVLLINGCSFLPEKINETTILSTRQLYLKANDAYMNNNWPKCCRYFEIFQGRQPTGLYAMQAQLNVAYCYYRDNNIADANRTIDNFIKLYPNHFSIDYAYYLKGLINFNDDLGLFGRFSNQKLADRDPKLMQNSYESFKKVLNCFPKSKYANDAMQHSYYIINSLVAHEIHVAEYYYKHGAYIAAVNRAQKALILQENSSNNNKIIEKALYLMIKSYQKLKETQLADDTYHIFLLNFPKSPYIKQIVCKK